MTRLTASIILRHRSRENDWEKIPWHSTSTIARPGRGKPFDTTGMKPGDYLPNPDDSHSFYQLADAGDGSLRPALHRCAMETKGHPAGIQSRTQCLRLEL